MIRIDQGRSFAEIIDPTTLKLNKSDGSYVVVVEVTQSNAEWESPCALSILMSSSDLAHEKTTDSTWSAACRSSLMVTPRIITLCALVISGIGDASSVFTFQFDTLNTSIT